jgi:hypothetical protein
MIRGLHGMIYSSDVERSRAFVRDKLRLPHTDVGGGWLIFDLPEGDLGFHPSEDPGGAGEHDVSFYCDDIAGTVAELRARGVEFDGEPQDHGYGWVTHFAIPGGIRVQLYEPRYRKGTTRAASAKRATKAKVKAKVKAKAKAKARPAVKKRGSGSGRSARR